MTKFFDMNNNLEARQPETKAIMRWLKRIQFTASASLHGVIFPFSNLADIFNVFENCRTRRINVFHVRTYYAIGVIV